MEGPGYVLKPLLRSAACSFFLSSGDDVLDQRDLFERLVSEFSNQFRLASWGDGRFHLETDRWEQDAARRTDGKPNDEFVRRAVAAHCTVVLLATSVRKGTREELEAVVAAKQTQLAVLHMKAPGTRLRDKKLREYLKANQANFLYNVTGAPGSIEACISMMRVICRTVADVTNPRRREELFYEDR